MIAATARPVAADGRAGSWSDPAVRVATWRGRRMPPFAGTPAEQHALAVHLARLGGDSRAGLEPRAVPAGGAHVFEEHCAACHGLEAAWPIRARLRGRSAAELDGLIGRLPQVRQEMPPFVGTDEDRRALAGYLVGFLDAAPLAGGGAVTPSCCSPTRSRRRRRPCSCGRCSSSRSCCTCWR